MKNDEMQNLSAGGGGGEMTPKFGHLEGEHPSRLGMLVTSELSFLL